MGMIGGFIDRAVREHPALMRKVLDRPFGDVSWWVHFDEEGDACGCLVGTMALVAGVNAEAADHDQRLAWRTVAALFGEQPWQTTTYAVGMAVSDVCGRFAGTHDEAEANALTVALLKRRIARALARRAAAPVAAATRLGAAAARGEG